MQYFTLPLKAIFISVGIGTLSACNTLNNHPLLDESPVVSAREIPVAAFDSLDPPFNFPRPAMKPPAPLARGRTPPQKPPVSGKSDGYLRLSPETLLGYSDQDVARLLGDAVENVQLPPSRVMRYRFADCRMTLYLYASLASGVYRVLYSEIDADGSLQPAGGPAQCVISAAQLPSRKTDNM